MRVQDVGMYQINVVLTATTDEASLKNKYLVVLIIDEGNAEQGGDSDSEVQSLLIDSNSELVKDETRNDTLIKLDLEEQRQIEAEEKRMQEMTALVLDESQDLKDLPAELAFSPIVLDLALQNENGKKRVDTLIQRQKELIIDAVID